jgi:hypothetical protein
VACRWVSVADDASGWCGGGQCGRPVWRRLAACRQALEPEEAGGVQVGARASGGRRRAGTRWAATGAEAGGGWQCAAVAGAGAWSNLSEPV